MEQLLTNPQTTAEWFWFALVALFTVVVALGGSGWIMTLLSRAHANTDLIKAEVARGKREIERYFSQVAPEGSPQQVYLESKIYELTKQDLVGLIQRAAGVDLPDDVEARLRKFEGDVDTFLKDVANGVVEPVVVIESARGG